MSERPIMAEGSDGPEDYGPTKYRYPMCRINTKLPKKWAGRKRKCPCCGRMIWCRMDFATHGDQRNKFNRKKIS